MNYAPKVHRQLSDLQKAKAFNKLKAKYRMRRRNGNGELRDLVATELGFGLSGRTLERFARLLELPLEIQHAVTDKQITNSVAEEILRLPRPVQQQIAADFAAGKRADRIRKQYGLAYQSQHNPQALMDSLVKRLRRDIPILSLQIEEVKCSDARVLEDAAQLFTQLAHACKKRSGSTTAEMPPNVAVRSSTQSEPPDSLAGT